MEVKIKQIKGLTFAAKGDTNHWLVMDTDEKYGGEFGASKPMELVLMALGGCSVMDVASILRKMKVQLDDLRMDVHADQAKDFPKVFIRIRMTYQFFGKNIPEENVKKAIELSKTKYCSVYAMLIPKIPIDILYQIIES